MTDNSRRVAFMAHYNGDVEGRLGSVRLLITLYCLSQLACPAHPTTIQGPFWNVSKDRNFTAILPQFYRTLLQFIVFFSGVGGPNPPPPPEVVCGQCCR